MTQRGGRRDGGGYEEFVLDWRSVVGASGDGLTPDAVTWFVRHYLRRYALRQWLRGASDAAATALVAAARRVRREETMN